MNTHHTLVHTVTEYDRAEARKRHWNPHALPLYLQACDRAESAIASGQDTRKAICSVFTGRLLDRVLKAFGLPKSTDDEQRI